MRCRKCGRPLRRGIRFCGYCGHPVPAFAMVRVLAATVVLIAVVFSLFAALGGLGGSRSSELAEEAPDARDEWGYDEDVSSVSSESDTLGDAPPEPVGSGSEGGALTDRGRIEVIRDVLSSLPDTLDGVDISGWQEGLSIPATDGDFFIIKATEGVSTEGKPATRFSPWYRMWAAQALATGRLVGFYHYANGGDAIAEADEFYEAIKDYQGIAIACLDWEGAGNPVFNTGGDVAWCKEFLDRLQSRYGGVPFVYMNKNHANSFDWSPVAQSYPLWGAQYASERDVSGFLADPWQSPSDWGAWGQSPTIFQYTSSGVLANNGGMDHLDLDKFQGSLVDWFGYAWWRGNERLQRIAEGITGDRGA